LYRDGALQRLHRTGELRQEPIAGNFEQPATTRCHSRIDDLGAPRTHARQTGSSTAAIADNCRAGGNHRGFPAHRPNRSIGPPHEPIHRANPSGQSVGPIRRANPSGEPHYRRSWVHLTVKLFRLTSGPRFCYTLRTTQAGAAILLRVHDQGQGMAGPAALICAERKFPIVGPVAACRSTRLAGSQQHT
jgi:hypothetical protein